MALITHPTANADSFTDLTYASDFFASRPASLKKGWVSLTNDADRENQLKFATKFLMTLCSGYEGERLEDLEHQLPYPRRRLVNIQTGQFFSTTEIPGFVQDATCVIADYTALVNPYADPSLKGFKKAKLDGLGLAEANPDDYVRTMPNEARLLLEPYCVIADAQQSANVLTVRF